jgi:hypothetical protein
MASWCAVRVTYDPRGYGQNYKRDIQTHSHQGAEAFVLAAKADSLTRVNAQRPANAQATLNDLGTTGLRVYMQADPGNAYRLI